jgi:arginase family enzyme
MKLRILDLDGGLTVQPALRRQRPEVVPCQGWGPRIRMGCSFGRFRRFERSLTQRLGRRPDDGPRLTFVGSGDFHHASLALVRRLTTPFNLLVIDNHPDWMRCVPVIHCGTWLWHAYRLPNVRHIYHVGGDVDFDNAYRYLAPWNGLKKGRITVFPAVRSYRGCAWRGVPHAPLREVGQERLSPDRLETLLQPHVDDLARYPLYVSLDKDVMSTTDAVVNWDSGHLGLGEARDVLAAFVGAADGRLAGMDVVGDWSPVTVSGWFRRLLHYSEHPPLGVAPHEALVVNDRTNQVLLDTLSGLGVYNSSACRRAAS